MGICRAAQKHTASRGGKIRVQTGISPSPRKRKTNQNQTQKTSWQSLPQGNHFALFFWNKEHHTTSPFHLACALWSPSPAMVSTCFWRPGNVEIPEEHSSFADSKTEQPHIRDVLPVYPQELKKHFQPIQPTDHQETDTALFGKFTQWSPSTVIIPLCSLLQPTELISKCE